jgi:Trk K+ transport system NAD-binding subunit
MAKVVGMGVMLLGAGFTAALVSLMADWLIARRLGSLFARVAVQMSNHAVIVGAGNVGARVAELLVERGHRVVVIERDAENPNIARLRAHHIPVVLGDASVREVLDQASSFDAGVVMALTERDAVNLHIGLTMDEADDDVPVVVRLLSPELTAHVQRTSHMHAISPVAAAADAVCALLVGDFTAARVDGAAVTR